MDKVEGTTPVETAGNPFGGSLPLTVGRIIQGPEAGDRMPEMQPARLPRRRNILNFQAVKPSGADILPETWEALLGGAVAMEITAKNGDIVMAGKATGHAPAETGFRPKEGRDTKGPKQNSHQDYNRSRTGFIQAMPMARG
jgi:hypothetical protein